MTAICAFQPAGVDVGPDIPDRLGSLAGRASGLRAVSGSSQLGQSRVDLCQHGRGPELRGDPSRLGQMLKGERALLFGLVKQAQDHLASADVMPIWVQLGVLPNALNKR